MNSISFYQLTQSESAELSLSVLGVVERQNPEVMGVKPLYDLLKAFEPQLSLITTPHVAHPLTLSIETDVKRAKQLCLAIVNQTKAVEQGKVEIHKDALFQIAPLVKKYLAKNYNSNRTAFADGLRNFVDAVNATETMRNAAKALGLEVYITELGVVKSRIDQNNVLRSEDLVAQRTVKEMHLRKALNKAMSNLLKAIDLAEVTNKTFDFGPLKTELGVLFTTYRSKLRSRTTRRLNTAIKKESVATTAKSVATESNENGHI